MAACRTATGGAFLVLLSACAPQPPAGVKQEVLAQEVGEAVGDPATCVVLAEAGTGKVLWMSAKDFTCARTLPSCTASPDRSVITLARDAARGGALTTGCGDIGWAAGPTRRKGVVYAAVMQGARALPGREIARRLDSAFEGSGL